MYMYMHITDVHTLHCIVPASTQWCSPIVPIQESVLDVNLFTSDTGNIHTCTDKEVKRLLCVLLCCTLHVLSLYVRCNWSTIAQER